MSQQSPFLLLTWTVRNVENLISFCSIYIVCLAVYSTVAFFLLSLCLFVHLSVFLIRFQEYWRGMPQVKVEPTLSQTLIIEEGRRRENGSCNIHMSYWLDCQPLAHAPSTYEVSQMTEDAMLCPPPSPASLLSPFLPTIHFLISRPYATSFFSTLSLSLLPLLLSPSLSLCHFFSSPSHLLPSLWRLWHAHGPNSIIGQIKEMLLNSLNRKKEHTHAPDMPGLQSHTYTKLTHIAHI